MHASNIIFEKKEKMGNIYCRQRQNVSLACKVLNQVNISFPGNPEFMQPFSKEGRKKLFNNVIFASKAGWLLLNKVIQEATSVCDSIRLECLYARSCLTTCAWREEELGLVCRVLGVGVVAQVIPLFHFLRVVNVCSASSQSIDAAVSFR